MNSYTRIMSKMLASLAEISNMDSHSVAILDASSLWSIDGHVHKNDKQERSFVASNTIFYNDNI